MGGGTRGQRGERGQIIDGRFELLGQLGTGGMGTVWRARDTALHREVALKEVRPPLSEQGDPDWRPPHEEDSQGPRALRERVLREARALARLSHPNVVTIHHIVDEGPYPWLVMELVPGSLEARLAEGPLEPSEAARMGREVLGALRTSHAAGIQHRDVKPANVLLREDGSAVLTDFGIAALQGSASLTATGEFLGSPEFIAPERARGTDDDPASDLWSLALTLYVCTEGHSPLRRTTTLATLAAVLDDPVPPPVRSGALGPVLEAVLVRDSGARPGPVELDRMLAEVAEGRAPAPYMPTQAALPLRPPPTAPTPPRPEQVRPGTPPHGRAQPGSPPGTPPHGGPATGFGAGPGSGPQDGGKRRGRIALAAVGVVVVASLLAGGTYLLTRPGDDEGDRADGGRTGQPADTSPSAEATGDEKAPPLEAAPRQPLAPREREGDRGARETHRRAHQGRGGHRAERRRTRRFMGGAARFGREVRRRGRPRQDARGAAGEGGRGALGGQRQIRLAARRILDVLQLRALGRLPRRPRRRGLVHAGGPRLVQPVRGPLRQRGQRRPRPHLRPGQEPGHRPLRPLTARAP